MTSKEINTDAHPPHSPYPYLLSPPSFLSTLPPSLALFLRLHLLLLPSEAVAAAAAAANNDVGDEEEESAMMLVWMRRDECGRACHTQTHRHAHALAICIYFFSVFNV